VELKEDVLPHVTWRQVVHYVLIAGPLLFSGVTAYYAHNTRISALELRAEFQNTKDNQQDMMVTANLTFIREMLAEIKSDIKAIKQETR
jgi:hypothetical protein